MLYRPDLPELPRFGCWSDRSNSPANGLRDAHRRRVGPVLASQSRAPVIRSWPGGLLARAAAAVVTAVLAVVLLLLTLVFILFPALLQALFPTALNAFQPLGPGKTVHGRAPQVHPHGPGLCRRL